MPADAEMKMSPGHWPQRRRHYGRRFGAWLAALRSISSPWAIVTGVSTRTETHPPPGRSDSSAQAHPTGRERRPLTVVDVALRGGPGYDGLGTYLRAKQRYAEQTPELIHHTIVPGVRESHSAGWHELPPAWRPLAREDRFTGRSQRLLELLGSLRADAIMLHGPFDTAQRAIEVARFSGARTVAVPHHAEPAPTAGLARARRWWPERREQQALRRVDAVIAPAAADASPRSTAVRLGVDPEFQADPSARRGREVVFAGELSPSAHVGALLLAANYPNMLWPLRIIGHGRQGRALQRAIGMYGLGHRVEIEPFITDRARLAAIFARAGCVVNPGEPGRCQLVMLEAAATGAPIVAPEGAPIATIAPSLTHTFPDRGIPALAEAIQCALGARPDPHLGARLAQENTWERAFARELEDLRAMLAG